MLEDKLDFLGANGSTHYYLNDRTSIDSNWTGGDPFYISVDSVDGLSSSDIEYEAHPIPNLIGEKSGDVFRRGKTLTLTGTIWGRNLNGLDRGAEYLEIAFWDTTARKLQFYPYKGALQAYITCRVSQDLSISRAKPQERNYRWQWVVGLRADDPRLYKVSGGTAYYSWQT